MGYMVYVITKNQKWAEKVEDEAKVISHSIDLVDTIEEIDKIDGVIIDFYRKYEPGMEIRTQQDFIVNLIQQLKIKKLNKKIKLMEKK